MKSITHWNKQKKQWTTHTYKGCTIAPKILVVGDWSTEIKPQRKTNPKGWIVSDNEQVIVNPKDELLSKFIKKEKLAYDKHNMEFSHNQGKHLLFDEDGCFIVERMNENE
jgi:hypothetical protein